MPTKPSHLQLIRKGAGQTKMKPEQPMKMRPYYTKREQPTVDIGNQGNAEEANNDSVEFGILGGMEVVNEPISFVSVFDPIGYNIPQKLKQKIWEGRFIDLSLLLKSVRELNMADESAGDLIIKEVKLAVERKVQQKSIYNIREESSTKVYI